MSDNPKSIQSPSYITAFRYSKHFHSNRCIRKRVDQHYIKSYWFRNRISITFICVKVYVKRALTMWNNQTLLLLIFTKHLLKLIQLLYKIIFKKTQQQQQQLYYQSSSFMWDIHKSQICYLWAFKFYFRAKFTLTKTVLCVCSTLLSFCTTVTWKAQ